MNDPLDSLQTPAVRDLAWTIASPALLDADHPPGAAAVHPAWCERALAECLPWLRELDRHPAPLHQWLAQQQDHLLGRRFELLIEFWLRHWQAVRLLGTQLKVLAGSRALGEFDFLFYDLGRETVIHWEVAVKFYLRHRAADGEYRWLGPNPRDTLAKKLHQVFRHQLRMAGQEEARPVLHGLGITRVMPEAFVKGYLFYPAAENWRHPERETGAMPPGIAPQHLKGWWTYAGKRQLPQTDSGNHWAVLERFAWLAPARSTDPGYERAQLDDFLDQHFDRSRRPLLLAELAGHADGIWREASRGFVVPDRWPQQ